MAFEHTLFGAWQTKYGPLPDEKLEKLASAVAKNLSKTIAYARDDIFAVAADQQNSQFVRMNARRIPKLRKALDKFLAKARPVIEQHTNRERVAIAAVDETVTQMTAALADLSKIAAEKAAKRSLEVNSNSLDAVWLIAFGVALSLLAAIGIAWVITRTISGPLRGMTKLMTKLAGGDLTIGIPGQKMANEIGDIARAVAVFQKNAVEKVQLEQEQAAEKVRADEHRRAELTMLAQNLNASVGEIASSLISSVGELDSSASSLSSMTNRANERSVSVVAATGQMSQNIQSVAVSTDQLVSAIQEISRQVAYSSEMANGAVDQTKLANKTVDDLVCGAKQIGSVIATITEIAEQTNLLALNATIESARAGEAGRGFAVVAQEVKALAAQTSAATGEIATQIEQIQEHCQNVAGVVRDIGGTIGEMESVSSTIAAAVEEQSAVTGEIAKNAQVSAQSANNISTDMGNVREDISNAETGNIVLRNVTHKLSGFAKNLHDEMDQFVRKLNNG